MFFSSFQWEIFTAQGQNQPVYFGLKNGIKETKTVGDPQTCFNEKKY